ncbi:hypothetical protein OOU_Y34scaffold00006g4, partial [Pyricularia oryzae Y34]
QEGLLDGIRPGARVSSILNNLQSAAGAVATSVPEIIKDIPKVISQAPQLISELVPKNCSLGTGEFCIQIGDKNSCDALPLDLSTFIEPEIVKVLKQHFQDIENVDATLTQITTPYFRHTLIAGVVLTGIATLLVVMSAYGRFTWLKKSKEILFSPKPIVFILRLLIGLLLCVPYIIPTLTLSMVRSKLDELPPWIEVENGDVFELLIGCTCCALFGAVISSAVHVFAEVF